METNRNLTDQQLDELILQSFERKEIAREIGVAVMKDLRRASRRAWLRRWGRVVAFSFGLPLVVVVFGWLLWPYFAEQVARRSYIAACLVLPFAAMFYLSVRALQDFSFEKV
ncbi:MAG: hypothetical protein IJ605_00170 [Prevotella sp.]|nr:hypothetical protein [Prevotella sp.]